MQSFPINLIKSKYVENDFRTGLSCPIIPRGKFITERVILSSNVLANGTMCIIFKRATLGAYLCLQSYRSFNEAHLMSF